MEYLKTHGTKILGIVLGTLGVVTTMQPDAITAVFGERGPGIVLFCGGLLTFLRGLQNSGVLPGGPPKQ